MTTGGTTGTARQGLSVCYGASTVDSLVSVSRAPPTAPIFVCLFVCLFLFCFLSFFSFFRIDFSLLASCFLSYFLFLVFCYLFDLLINNLPYSLLIFFRVPCESSLVHPWIVILLLTLLYYCLFLIVCLSSYFNRSITILFSFVFILFPVILP